MKKLVFLSSMVFALLLMFACNEEQITPTNNSGLNQNEQNPHNFILSNVLSSPTRTWHSDTKICTAPPHDCFDEVVVTAPKKVYYDELDNLILSDNVKDFFVENGDYLNIFTDFDGPALLDLRNNVTTLRKIVYGVDDISYYIVFRNDTNSTPDYSDYY